MSENLDKDKTEYEGEPTLDIDKLTAKEAKALLKEVFSRQSEIESKVKELIIQAENYKDKWIRNAAEFENYKKRTAQIRIQSEQEGKNYAIKSILPIGDNLERALTMPLDDKTKDGINMVLRSFNEVLEGLGVESIDPIGEVFDPHLHEAVMQCEDGDCQSGTVNEVLLKGYKLGDKIIRYAQVKVVS